MTEIGKARVRVEFDQDSVNEGVDQTRGGILGRFKGMGAAGGALLAGGIATGAVAAGAALYGVGSTFDDVADTIRVGTGATGKSLDNLVGTAKTIGATVPSNFADIGTAVSGLNQRLGLTGKPLETLSAQFLNLSRLTGTDLNTNINNITRVFGDWGIKTGDQAGAMDKLYRASQATGAGIDSLSQGVVKFGGPMRQLGFSFEDTLAILGKFEKEGVNTDLVMGSMRQALGRMAKAGEAPVATLQRVMGSIKNAGDAGKANALALELFGARAGPDMAAAIREGRFEIGDMVKTISSGSDTIAKGSDDTADFAEAWQTFKNQALVQIEPLATKVFGLLGDGMKALNEDGLPVLKSIAATVGNVLGPVFDAVGPSIGKLFSSFGELKGVGATFGAIGKTIGDFVSSLMPTIRPLAAQIVGVLVPGFKSIWAVIQTQVVPAFQRFLPAVAPIARFLIGVIGGAVVGALRGAIGVIRGVFKVIAGLFNVFGSVIRGDWFGVWQGIKQIASGVWDAIKGAFEIFLNVGIGKVFSLGARAILGIGRKLWSGISGLFKSGMSAAGRLVSSGMSAVGRFFSSGVSAVARIVGRIVEYVTRPYRDAFNTARRIVGDGMSAVSRAVSSGIDKVANFFRGLPGRIRNAVGNIASKVSSIGSSIIDGIVSGLRNAAGRITSAVRSYVIDKLPGPVRKALGIGSPSKVFAEIGYNTSLGMAVGIEKGAKRIDPSVLIPQPPNLAGATARGGVATSAALAGAGDTFNFYMRTVDLNERTFGAVVHAARVRQRVGRPR